MYAFFRFLVLRRAFYSGPLPRGACLGQVSAQTIPAVIKGLPRELAGLSGSLVVAMALTNGRREVKLSLPLAFTEGALCLF
jgi:hypothetical protein